MNNKIEELISTLKERGASDTEIAVIIREVTQMSAMELYSYLLSLIKDDDKSKLDDLTDDEEAYNKLMIDLFQKYTGKSMQQVVSEIQGRLIDSFLQDFQSETD